MITEIIIKLLSSMPNLFERDTIVRLDGVEYRVSHVEHKDTVDVIVIYLPDGD